MRAGAGFRMIPEMATEIPVPRSFSVSVRSGPAGIVVRPIRSSPIWNTFAIEFEADSTVSDPGVDEVQGFFHGDMEGYRVLVYGAPATKIATAYGGARPGQSGKWKGTLTIEPALAPNVQSLTVHIGRAVFVLDVDVEPLAEVAP